MKSRIFVSLLLGLILLFTLATPALAAPPSREYLKFRGHFYKGFTDVADRTTWESANTIAAGLTYYDPKSDTTYYGHRYSIVAYFDEKTYTYWSLKYK